MATTASRATVAAPVEAVWEALAVFADISRWARAVNQSSMLTAGPPGPGACRRVQVGRMAVRETVEIWDPGHRMAYRIEGLPAIVVSAVNTWTLTALDQGGTEITLTGEITTKVPPAARLVAGRVGKTNDELVADLVAHVEHLTRRQA